MSIFCYGMQYYPVEAEAGVRGAGAGGQGGNIEKRIEIDNQFLDLPLPL